MFKALIIAFVLSAGMVGAAEAGVIDDLLEMLGFPTTVSPPAQPAPAPSPQAPGTHSHTA